MSQFIKMLVVTLSLFTVSACMEMTDADDEPAGEVQLPAEDEESVAWDAFFDGAPDVARDDITPYIINQACGDGCVNRWIRDEGTCRALNLGWYDECMARAHARYARCLEACGGGGGGGGVVY